jgi:hypothetical protein
MTPTVTALLNGCIPTLATPPRPEDAGLFAGARIRLVAMMNRLVALESADGAACACGRMHPAHADRGSRPRTWGAGAN